MNGADLWSVAAVTSPAVVYSRPRRSWKMYGTWCLWQGLCEARWWGGEVGCGSVVLGGVCVCVCVRNLLHRYVCAYSVCEKLAA